MPSDSRSRGCACLIALASLVLAMTYIWPSGEDNQRDAGQLRQQKTLDSLLASKSILNINADDVQKVVVSLKDLRDFFGEHATPIEAFVVPIDYKEPILKALFPAKRFAYPAAWDETPFGQIRIIMKTGEILSIIFVCGGSNPLCFSVKGVRYMRAGPYQIVADDVGTAESAFLECAICDLYKVSIKKSEGANLSTYLEHLRRSRGEPALHTPNGKKRTAP